MSSNAARAVDATTHRSPVEIARELGPIFAERAATATATDEDQFVAENFAALKEAGLVEAGVPTELGGGGASIDELAEMLRILGQHCGSTALAFSMHTHQVAIPAWRWKVQKAAPVEPLLKRIAAERIFLLSSGGSDWIGGSGKAEKVDGGYRITARKVFASGSPAANLFMTTAVLESEGEPAQVLHFGLPMNSPQVKVMDNWRTLGMRGTGSNDVMIDGHVVPEAAVAVKRKAGEWHPLFQIIATIAFPLIYSVYLGVAESARDIAVGVAKKKKVDNHMIQLAGRMDTELAGARLAREHMLAAVRLDAPSAETINQVMTGRTLVARHAIATVELAMELAGGAGFYRATGLERRFRDIQAARYHPLQAGPQAQYAGSMALGLPVDKVF
ncbi:MULTISPECIES: acyl-CoA dehydrogenase family protein [unclassified Bradyrhizobium]|uniref:acyl-CoA dehydrogenase family protein n=2 Tax=Bradyrhizobium TaxID=374 RepID=UPI001BACEA6A|nr:MULTISPECIES: acyl-CoA dehydrogenase family protein [unclassified Bradyrhizobium]MBR1232186.1 acyl-CoA dehydrogenase family protein [Bradyrhizobium sp. AUGA SZCCT0182]MBR1298078.1 acyl-CoA dehydrogenase family protein [Bradyrhizobium sp. AUGA SZCCT0042]